MIQDNQNELIEAAKETNSHSFCGSTSTVKIHTSDTSVKSKISLAQKMPMKKQQLLPHLSLKKTKLLLIPDSEIIQVKENCS